MNYFLYSGAGNTFALTEDPLSASDAKRLCEDCDVDGVIFKTSSSSEEIPMHILNRDGSEAEMCGNGLRCFIKFLIQQNISRDVYHIQTLAGMHKAWINGENVCVQCPPPKDFRWNLTLESCTVHALNTGVPHAVIFVDSVEEIDLQHLGPKIRYHSFFPKGTNVNVVQKLNQSSIRIRTYERGVEAETLACGTGTVAAALAAAHELHIASPLTVHVQSGECVLITFSPDWKTIVMEGPAQYVGKGVFHSTLSISS